MYKILLVEDEDLIRDAIANILDWPAIGITEIFQAEDGELGLELARKHRPDIVLTDIRMPFMDGLEMAKYIAQELPYTKIIILTGHDEFDFAVSSIKLGITDYIMKPISAENLSTVINKTVLKLQEERRTKRNQQKLRNQLRQSLPLLKEKILNQIITSSISPNKLNEKLEYTELQLDFNTFTVCIVELGTYDDLSVEDSEMMNMMLKGSLENYLGQDAIVFSNYKSQQIILLRDLPMDDYETRAQVHQRFFEHHNGFKEKQACYLNTSIGITVDSMEKISESYETAKHALSYKTALGNDLLFDFLELGYKSPEFEYPRELVDEIVKSAYLNIHYQTSLTEMKKYLSLCKNLTAEHLRVLAFEIVTHVNKALLETDYNLGEDSYQAIYKACNIATLTDFEKCITEYLDKIYSFFLENKQTRKQLLIQNAKQYMEDNYENPDLNLNMVASHIFINPTYLSALFKKEAGVSFVDFLTQIRIEKAKFYLAQENTKSYEAALKSGYQDPHYFSVCFKKQTGMSPSEYKKKIGLENE
jgi:two-component system, response regulator YesN